jgi:hypothetical protein
MRGNFAGEGIIPRSDPWYPWLGVWQRFDTLWYVHIASAGYNVPQSIVFYPLYPILIRGVTALLGQPVAAALLVSTVSAFFLFWGLQKLLLLDYPAGVVRRTLVLYGIWPASFILFAGYAESTVIALIVWSVYLARTGRWWLAGTIGLFAGLAKAIGVLVAIPLAVLAWRDRKWRALPAVLCLLGPLSFAAWLNLSGRPLPSEIYQRYWGTELSFPWITILEGWKAALANKNISLQLNWILFLAVSFLSLLRRLRLEYMLYAAVALLFVLLKKSDPSQQQWARYALVMFPAFVNLAQTVRDRAILSVGTFVLFALNVLSLWIFLEWSLAV